MKKRKPSEFARIYGSKERVAWVKSLPCCWCGIVGYSQNAHTVGGGMGYKADHHTIAPLCYTIHRQSCHQAYDQRRGVFAAEEPRAFVQAEAARIAAEWDSRSLASARLAEGV